MDKTKKKIRDLWILYAVQAVPAALGIISSFIYNLFGIFEPPESVHQFVVNHFPFYWDFFRYMGDFCSILCLLLIIALLIAGRKIIFSKISSVVVLFPYLLPWVGLLISVFFAEHFNGLPFSLFKATILLTFYVMATQIFIIIKLAKVAKQLKA